MDAAYRPATLGSLTLADLRRSSVLDLSEWAPGTYALRDKHDGVAAYMIVQRDGAPGYRDVNGNAISFKRASHMDEAEDYQTPTPRAMPDTEEPQASAYGESSGYRPRFRKT